MFSRRGGLRPGAACGRGRGSIYNGLQKRYGHIFQTLPPGGLCLFVPEGQGPCAMRRRRARDPVFPWAGMPWHAAGRPGRGVLASLVPTGLPLARRHGRFACERRSLSGRAGTSGAAACVRSGCRPAWPVSGFRRWPVPGCPVLPHRRIRMAAGFPARMFLQQQRRGCPVRVTF